MSTGIDTADLPGLVAAAAHRAPHKPAWVFDATGVCLTFDDVDRRSREMASALDALGVRAGDRVAVMLRNRPEFPLLWLALARIGGVLVPVNTGYRELDGAHVLAHSGSRIAVTDAEFAPLLRTIAPCTAVERVVLVHELAPEGAPPEFDPVPELATNIQYTSGTTGQPKGCVLSHRYWTTLAEDLATAFPAVSDTDTMLTAQPFHYIDPQWNVALGLRSCATLVVLDRFHPSTFWHKVREYGVTWFYCLGLMPTLLLREPRCAEDRNHRVRAITASAIPPERHAELERRWGVPWFEAFGMTETGGDIRVYPHDHDEVVGTGCIGTPAPHREAMIAGEDGGPVPRGEPGELVLRGVGLMHGYHNDTEATAHAFRGGWFHTGDLARMDAAGRVYYLGRTKDMIRRSGENVSAEEVERVVGLHADVHTAAVVPVPDELRGEEIKAFVVLEDGTRSADGMAESLADSMAAFCRDKLAYFKIPRYWTFVDILPTTPSERVAKGRLRSDGADPRAGAYDRVDRCWR